MYYFFRGVLTAAFVTITMFLAGCVTPTGQVATDTANAQADTTMYKPVNYANRSKKGPYVIVLPGEIKSNNSSFLHKFSANNIADFAELELGRDNFRVLERSDLGPMLNEIKLAVAMGDPTALKKFKRGKFKSTKWFIKFDVLKAEKVAESTKGFDGRALGAVVGSFIGGLSGAATGVAAGSVKVEGDAGVWVIGMRYKLIDASTTEQVATNYFEKKMEVGADEVRVMGVKSKDKRQVTLDSMVQRLIQECVADIDRYK